MGIIFSLILLGIKIALHHFFGIWSVIALEVAVFAWEVNKTRKK